MNLTEPNLTELQASSGAMTVFEAQPLDFYPHLAKEFFPFPKHTFGNKASLHLQKTKKKLQVHGSDPWYQMQFAMPELNL